MTELIDIDGTATHVHRIGSGTPLILVHGFTGSIESMAPLAHHLAHQHEVISLDVVGHGGSAIPRTPFEASMAVAVAQVLGLVGDDRAHIVGYSMGGRVALAAAVAAPARFRSGVVIGAHPGLEDAAERSARCRADDRLADTIEARGIEWFVNEWMARPIFESQRRHGAAALSAARQRRLRNDATGLANSLRGMGTGAQEPVWSKLTGVDLPLLYLAGQHDPKFVAIGRRVAAVMPSCRLIEVADAGHAAHEERTDQVATYILEHTARSQR